MGNAGPLTIEGARIIFRNFAGKEGQYNREGDRNFGLCLDTELAEVMERDGWNIKYLTPKEDGDEPQAFVQVSVNFKNRPPNVVLINHKGRTTLPEDQIELLDWVDIKTVDLIINPYSWAVNGKTGISAYLKSLFVTIEEDELDLKYADLEDLTPRGGRIEE
jgi:hypothetical protein